MSKIGVYNSRSRGHRQANNNDASNNQTPPQEKDRQNKFLQSPGNDQCAIYPDPN